MKQVKGIYLPESDTHFEVMFPLYPEIDGKASYQYDKIQAVLKHRKGSTLWRTEGSTVAIDIGAHVGLWSRILAMHFDHVYAFEPVFGSYFRKNVTEERVKLYEYALGNENKAVSLCVENTNSGNTFIAPNTELTGQTYYHVEQKTLDTFAFALVDFIKIDVEGFEAAVIEGSIETLKRCKPLVMVEQKGHEKRYQFKKDAITLLKELGAEIITIISGDYLMGWKDE